MMKLKITNELKKIVPSFKVSCYTFTTLEKNDKENLSNDLTEAFNNIAKEYQEKYNDCGCGRGAWSVKNDSIQSDIREGPYRK